MPSTDLVRKELDERAANNLIDFVANTASLVFEQSFDYTTDFPGFIASPTVEPGPFGVAKAIARQSCRRWARGQGIPSLPGFDGFYGSICEPYLEGLGEMPADGTLGPDFLGGQCDAVYTVNYTLDSNNSGATTGFLQARGPIRGIVSVPINGTNSSIRLKANGVNISGSPNCRAVANTGAADYALGSVLTATAGPPKINSVTPCGVDNCGNPPPKYGPAPIPPGLPPLQPVTVNVPGIGPVKVDVSFDDEGNVIVSLPDLGIDVTVPNPLSTGDDGGGDDDIPGDQGQPGLPAVGGDGEAAEGGDENRILLGVKVDLLSSPPRANQIFNETETYTKGAYFVYLGGDGGYEQVPSAAIVRDEQFFTAPEGCNRFRVVPNVGFAILVTPYYERED